MMNVMFEENTTKKIINGWKRYQRRKDVNDDPRKNLVLHRRKYNQFSIISQEITKLSMQVFHVTHDFSSICKRLIKKEFFKFRVYN